MNRAKWLCTLLVVGQLGLLPGCERLGDCGDAHKAESSTAVTPEGTGANNRGLTLSAAEADAAGVKVALLEERQVPQQIIVTATIQANQDRLAHVAPRVSSRVVSVSANLGDHVRQGQTLASLDSVELGEAHAAYLKARIEAALAQRNLARSDGLYKEQIVPEKDYLRVRAEAEIAQTAAQAAADRLRLLGVDPNNLSAIHAASVFPLTTPFSGTVTEKHAVLGDLARPDEALFTIADLSILWIEANVFESDLQNVRIGEKASLTVAAYPNDTFSGRVRYISSALDKATRTVRARIEVSNPDGRLKPEMFATAAIDVGRSASALAVPAKAVVLLQDQPTVFAQAGAVFEPKPVQLGDTVRGEVVIKSGIKAGEHVVVSGAYALKAKLLKSQIGDSH